MNDKQKLVELKKSIKQYVKDVATTTEIADTAAAKALKAANKSALATEAARKAKADLDVATVKLNKALALKQAQKNAAKKSVQKRAIHNTRQNKGRQKRDLTQVVA